MSPDEMLPGPDSCSADVAAYALGALESTEARAFARHLETCAVCPVELAAFRQVVDDIAMSAPRTAAPAALKRRVMSAVEAEPHPGSAPQRAPRAARLWPRLRWRWRPSLPAFALASGGAFAVAAVVVGILLLPGREGNRTIRAQVVGSGEVALRLSDGHAELLLHHVTPPPKGKIYEVWLKRGSSLHPAGELFSVDRNGDGSAAVPGSLEGVSKVLVTPEPAGGTPKPTSAPVFTATL